MTPEQTALLSTLAYTDTLHAKRKNGTYSAEGSTLGDYLFATDAHGNRYPTAELRDNPPTGFTQAEWDSTLTQVMNDPELCNLTVKDVTLNKYDDAIMLTLTNEQTHEAVICYQGTASPEGWNEDLKSGYSITKSQQRAIDYANTQTADLGDYYVYATGHSKGGNEAALVAVECDGVDQAFAFDAPGNAQAYFDDPTHAARARDNAYKVSYYSQVDCFVSPLNPRYDAKEYWLTSDRDPWRECEGLKGYFQFCPYAHATAYLFNSAGGFTYADGPNPHFYEFNRFTRWLESTLPPEDARYLLDALGIIIKDIMLLKDEDLALFFKLLADIARGEDPRKLVDKYGEGLVSLVDALSQSSLKGIDPKTLALLLAALEEYPYTSELLASIFGDKIDPLIKSLDFGAIMRVFKDLLKLLGPVGQPLLALINATGAMKDYYRGKWRVNRGSKVVKRVVRRGISAVFHTHDFSDEKLQQIEQLVERFKSSPINSLFHMWSRMYGGLGWFRWLVLSPMQNLNITMTNLLDQAIDALMRIVRQKFQEAWRTDEVFGVRITKISEGVRSAEGTLRELL